MTLQAKCKIAQAAEAEADIFDFLENVVRASGVCLSSRICSQSRYTKISASRQTGLNYDCVRSYGALTFFR